MYNKINNCINMDKTIKTNESHTMRENKDTVVFNDQRVTWSVQTRQGRITTYKFDKQQLLK